MRGLLVALALLVCGPALGNDRQDSEAGLAALAKTVIPALGAALPVPDGMVCTATDPDPSPTNRLLFPNWRGECRWTQEEEEFSASVLVLLSSSLSTAVRQEIRDAKGQDGAVFGGAPDPVAVRLGGVVKAAPSSAVVVLIEATGNRAAPGLDRLVSALATMDGGALDARADVQAHGVALAAHRQVLGAQVVSLAALLPPATDGRDPARRPAAKDFPDHMFFGFEPLVQVQIIEAGVQMTVTLTTSSFSLENARAEGLMALKNGETGPQGVMNDRGRVKVFLQETALFAVIDNRAILMLHVPEVAPGTDPVAAMEAVLARIAAHDFTGY